MIRLVLAASAALWAGTALASPVQGPIITWSRDEQTATPAPLMVPSGQVIFTRTPSDLPNGLTAQELAVKLATQELTLQTLQRQQAATTVETKEYARLQAELARAQAEKEAIARSMAANQEQLQTQNQMFEARLATLQQAQLSTKAETKEYARLQAELARAQAEKEAIAHSMAASTQHVATQAAATEARLTDQLQQQNSEIAARLGQQLKEFTTHEIASANAATAELASQVKAISASQVPASQVAQIAAQQVAAAKPEFEASAQALALQNLVAAKPYLQTIARGAVADADPAMQQALGQAVGKALAEQGSPAAFSIRKAVVDELTAVTQGAISATQTTRLGNDIEPAAGSQEQLDAARLRLGRLLAPGAATPEPGSQVASLPAVESPEVAGVSLQRARTRTDLMNLRDYKVVVHEDGQTLPDILGKVMKRAEPFTGPWQLKWKVSAENQDLLTEKFSLDAETTFDEFVSYLAQYLLNDRGVKLSFSLFDRERVVLVSD